MEQSGSIRNFSPALRAVNERVEKWREHVRVEAIRARGYEADEILIHTEERS